MHRKQAAVDFLKEQDKLRKELRLREFRRKTKNRRAKYEDMPDHDKQTENEVAIEAIEKKSTILRNDFRSKMLLEEYNTKTKFQYFYPIMFCAERIVYGMVLAVYTNNVDYQIFVMATVTAVVSFSIQEYLLEYDMAGSLQAIQLPIQELCSHSNTRLSVLYVHKCNVLGKA